MTLHGVLLPPCVCFLKRSVFPFIDHENEIDFNSWILYYFSYLARQVF